MSAWADPSRVQPGPDTALGFKAIDALKLSVTITMFLEVLILSLGVLPLLLLPLPGQLRARNVAVLALVITLFLVNLIRGINAVYSTP
jgi:hypothetical protein